jgi:K+-sensing histidine kinase KdpD
VADRRCIDAIEAASSPSLAQDVADALAYAEDLGAEVVRATGASLAVAIADTCVARRVTHLVLPHEPARGVRGRLRPSLADQVLERVPAVEVHLIASPAPRPGPHPSRP